MEYHFWKQLLFRFEPETAHHLLLLLNKILAPCPFSFSFLAEHFAFFDERLQIDALGLQFSSPIGLAAGFDKNAQMIPMLAALGFSHLELGTITPKPQEGNPKPRLFRLQEEQSLQNAMGFNNEGQIAVAKRLEQYTPFVIPLGINIGKNKTTSNEDSLKDYIHLLHTLHSYASYLVFNVSSPNTPGLRDLQNEEFIKTLFGAAKEITSKPILLKIAPDMSEKEAVELASFAVECGASGIIATNTTIDYSLSPHAKSFGGISGKLLCEKSKQILKALSSELFGKTTLISVGGIDSAEEVYSRIRLGASLVQIYTALIYQGPGLICRLKKDLIQFLQRDGFLNIQEAIGVDIGKKC